jgi:hypothetical protein
MNEIISPARFAFVFERFREAVVAHSPSDGPFSDFQTGLAGRWENYKDWLYLEARRRLNASSWKKNAIGKGEILRSVIKAIHIREDQDHRNNIVEWESKGRPNPEAISDHKLIVSQDSATSRAKTEAALYRMFVENADPEDCFTELVEACGARYDLISYLFFIRDWNQFLPLRPNAFETAFEMLGAPLAMVKKCSWSNYSAFLRRVRQVQGLLGQYEIPNGVRLIDAHSFCWMLASSHIKVSLRVRSVTIVAFTPRAGDPPSRKLVQRAFSQHDLDELLTRQRRIGNSAQLSVLRAEQDRLRDAGRADLAALVTDVSDNVSLGYDIASFTSAGDSKPIEVKAAGRRGDDLRFFLSENERAVSQTTDRYTFALVLDSEGSSPVIAEFMAQDLPSDAAHAVAYEVRLRTPPEVER